MKIGYPCQNWAEELSTNHTFRLNSFSDEKLVETIQKNIDDFSKILDYNFQKNFLFFRLGSNFVPFASHPICKYNWRDNFKNEFQKLGKKISKYKMRISMHPGQYTILNSKDEKVINRSIAELIYHCDLLDLLGLDKSSKIQIHVGFPYQDKEESMHKFTEIFRDLPQKVKNRLAIENDDKFFRISDCLKIHDVIEIPIIFDTFHFELLPDENFLHSFEMVHNTWKKFDGLPMIDYSSQQKGARKGKHSSSINTNDFSEKINQLGKYDFDIMLELKDKEASALKASKIFQRKKLLCN